MPNLFFGKSLHVNLSDGAVEERDIPDAVFEEKIGGAALASELMVDAKEGCIAFGSGPLTGVPCPGASAAVAAIQESDGKQRFSPILLNGGIEFKLSGFDFIVIEGRAEKTSYLWIRDQLADIVEAEHLQRGNSWSTCLKVRSEQGDPRIQVISASEGSCANLNLVSGWDHIGLGAEMRGRNLKAIAFRGLGDLEVSNADQLLKKGSEMIKDARERIGNKAGIKEVLDPQSARRLHGLRRNRACFSCPFPCMSYSESGSEEFAQILLMDQMSISRLARMQGSDEYLPKALMRLHKSGFCANEELESSGMSLENIADENQEVPDKVAKPMHFDTFTDNIGESDLIASGYILGLCPRYIGLFHIDISPYCELLSAASGTEISMDHVMSVAGSLIKGNDK